MSANEPNVVTDPSVTSEATTVTDPNVVSEPATVSEPNVASAAYTVYRARDTYFHGARTKLAALLYSGGDRISWLFMCRGREVAKAMARERAETWARGSGRLVVDADLPGNPLMDENPEAPVADPQTGDGEGVEE